MPAKASVEQIKAIIKETKAEERKWTAIDQWLDEQTPLSHTQGVLMRDEVMDYLEAHRLDVRETLEASGDEGNLAEEELNERAVRLAREMIRDHARSMTLRHGEVLDALNDEGEAMGYRWVYSEGEESDVQFESDVVYDSHNEARRALYDDMRDQFEA